MSSIVIQILGKDITSIVRKYLLPKIKNNYIIKEINYQSYYFNVKRLMGNYKLIEQTPEDKINGMCNLTYCVDYNSCIYLHREFKDLFNLTFNKHFIDLYHKVENLTYSDVLRSNIKDLIKSRISYYNREN